MKKPLTLSYGNLVIGSSLEALLFAYYCRTKCIWTRCQQPMLMDEFKIDFGLGISKYKAWNRYSTGLGLAGFMPFENKITSIKVVESNLVRVTTFDKGWYFIKFNKLIVFDDHELYGLEPHTGITDTRIQLVDRVRIQGYSLQNIESEPLRKEYMERLYTFERRKQKEMLVFSTIEEELKFYPEYRIRLNVENMLQNRRKSRGTTHSVQHIDRIVRPLGRNIYSDTDTINFVYKSIEELYLWAFPVYDTSYLHYLNARLNLKCEKTYRDTLQALSQSQLPR